MASALLREVVAVATKHFFKFSAFTPTGVLFPEIEIFSKISIVGKIKINKKLTP